MEKIIKDCQVSYLYMCMWSIDLFGTPGEIQSFSLRTSFGLIRKEEKDEH